MFEFFFAGMFRFDGACVYIRNSTIGIGREYWYLLMFRSVVRSCSVVGCGGVHSAPSAYYVMAMSCIGSVIHNT